MVVPTIAALLSSAAALEFLGNLGPVILVRIVEDMVLHNAEKSGVLL